MLIVLNKVGVSSKVAVNIVERIDFTFEVWLET
jgi:hypothetical protein